MELCLWSFACGYGLHICGFSFDRPLAGGLSSTHAQHVNHSCHHHNYILHVFLQGIKAVAPGEHVAKLDEEQIKEMAIIYKKESKRPLTNYQKRVNEAAIELSLQHPGLLHTRKHLMETARAKVIEDGYQFVKGKSERAR